MCLVLYHRHCSTGPYNNSLCWFFLDFFDKSFFPEVPCGISPNTKASLFLSVFLLLSSFFLSNWGNGHPLWLMWLLFLFRNEYPCLWFFCMVQGGINSFLLIFHFIGHISGWGKHFIAGTDITNWNHRDVVQSYPCCSIGTYIYSPR